MRYLHTMVRVNNLTESLDFYINKLGLVETHRKDVESGRYTLVFLATEHGAPELELTYNWDQKDSYSNGRAFGHLAYEVDNIYETCEHLQNHGVIINRPPRDGYMAFIKSPDGISIELLQKGKPLPIQDPWKSMANEGQW